MARTLRWIGLFVLTVGACDATLRTRSDGGRDGPPTAGELGPRDAAPTDAAPADGSAHDASPGDAGQSAPDVSPLSGGMQLGTNFWNLGWGIWDDVFKPNVDFATTTDPWNPAFLAEVKHYRVLRFMDFGQVNDSQERTWSERTPKAASPPAQQRLAYEWMVDLCNRTDTDMWVTVPTFADDDYVLQLAQLIAGSLKAPLRVFVEWTNEAWNFQQARGEACAVGNDLVPGDPEACAKGYVARAVRIFKQFEDVFGASNPRLVTVLAGQSVNTWLTGQHLQALADPKINPDGVMPRTYAIAPYFGHGLDGNAGDAVSMLRGRVSSDALDSVKAQVAALKSSGMTLIAYEGGQHVTTGADAVNADPEMYAIYTEYLDAMAPHFSVFCHYLHNGQWSSGGAWGAERFVGQPLAEAHKLRAIFDWIAAHP